MNAFFSDVGMLLSRFLWGGLRRAFGVRKGRVYRFLGKGKLSQEQERLLALMRRDNEASKDPYRATDFWIRENQNFDDLFQVEGIRDVESQTVNLLFSGHPPTRLLEYCAWMLYKEIKTHDRLGLLRRVPATVSRESGLGFKFEGNLVSWDYLISVSTLYAIAEVCKGLWTEPLVVVDLGSGWGRIGYILKSVNSRCTYIACDLPEGLLVSSAYLPQILPNEKVHPYTANRAVPEFTKDLLFRDGGIRFCGPQDLERFSDKAIDVFINVASFQEMTREQVVTYFRIIDRKVRGVFYLQEYWDGVRMGHTGQEIANYAEYPFFSSWEQCFTRNAPFSDLYFESACRIS